ncbi:MAG: biotin/lipoyl-containing protein, partial [Aurantimonas coralicida]|nr:biotin/lipoyl-containing protein [Aurantimonas coralicida]
MPIQILMPALSPTMEEGNLSKWIKQEGDTVSPGDVIAEIETDKATMEVEAVEEGTLGKILVPAGTEGVRVNAPIALLLAEGEDESALEDGAATAAKSAPDESAKNDEAPATAETSASSGGDMEARRVPAEGKVHPEPEDEVGAFGQEIPEGTEMVSTTVREALRSAMAEELRRDDDVFVMGEEVAEYEGAYKITQGLLAEFGARRIVDTPITEHG